MFNKIKEITKNNEEVVISSLFAVTIAVAIMHKIAKNEYIEGFKDCVKVLNLNKNN